jgi:hypothetical protein
VYHHRWSSTTSSGYSFKPSNPLSQKLGGFSFTETENDMYGKKPMKPMKKPAKPGKYAPKK